MYDPNDKFEKIAPVMVVVFIAVYFITAALDIGHWFSMF